MKSMMKAGTAALALAAAFAVAPAAADSYSRSNSDNYNYNYNSYQHRHHHHMRQAMRNTDRSMRDMNGREESMSNRDEMRNRDEMQARNMPAGMQVPLASVHDMNKLKDADVRDQDGNSVGHVRDVVLGSDGDARAVKVAIGGFWGIGTKKVVTIDARDMLYERDRNELTTDLSKRDIDSLEPSGGKST